MKKEYCIPKVNTIHLENHIDLLQPSEPKLPGPMGLVPCDDASSKPFEDVG